MLRAALPAGGVLFSVGCSVAVLLLVGGRWESLRAATAADLPADTLPAALRQLAAAAACAAASAVVVAVAERAFLSELRRALFAKAA
jgi:hypothetical protein